MRRALPYIALALLIVAFGAALYFYFANRDSGLTAEPGVTNPFETVGGSEGNTGGDIGVDGGVGGGDSDSWQVDEEGDGWQSDAVAPRLVKIAAGPVAVGAVALDRTDIASTTPLDPQAKIDPLATLEVRYVMRGSGNVFSYLAHEGKSIRLSNRTIPGIQDAHWLSDGSLAYVRFLGQDADGTDRVLTSSLSSDGASATLLASDIASLDTLGTRALTLMTSTGGTSASVVDGSGAARAAFASPIIGLRAAFLGSGYLAWTKPSSHIQGYAFSVSAAGSMSRLLGPLRALSAKASPTGATVLASYLDGSTFRLGALTPSTGAYVSLPLQTLADKCVFSPDGLAAYCAVPTLMPPGDLPDAWYQGLVSFTDRIWKIDFPARVTTLEADLPVLTKEPIDAVGLSLNPAGTALVFTNRRDNSLWAYAL